MPTDTAGTLLARAIARAGDRVALRARGEVRTHQELLGNAARFANALAAAGVRPGDHVALMVADRVESVEAYVGCLLGGFAAIHLNDRWAGREVEAVLADADPRAFVYTGEVAPKLSGLAAVEALDVVVAIGDRADGRHLGWNSLLEASSSSLPQVARAPSDLSIVGYTSGTTGTPKGVMHTEYSIVRILQHMPTHFDIRPRSRCAMTGTLSFVAGIWGVVLPHLYLGGEVSFMAGLPVDEWCTRMVEEGSNFTYVPTPLASAFAEELGRQPKVLETLRSAMHSGSQMPAPVMQRVVEATRGRFATTYGMTETGAPVTRTEAGDWTKGCEAADVWASSGRAAHIMDVSVVGSDGAPLGSGETGEITVSSDTMFAGYYKRPEVTAEAVVGGRLRTGDIGRLDEAGYLYVTDRLKDMIVSGGMNVFPAEVEAALVDVAGLSEIAVFGVPDEKWGERVVAVAVRSDPSLDQDAVIAAARERIASYKKPTSVQFVDALPRTASLKIDKPELRRRWAAARSS
jgi:fatty-acyl-CoA synthase